MDVKSKRSERRHRTSRVFFPRALRARRVSRGRSLHLHLSLSPSPPNASKCPALELERRGDFKRPLSYLSKGAWRHAFERERERRRRKGNESIELRAIRAKGDEEGPENVFPAQM